MIPLRLIGDVHGNYDEYLKLLPNAEYTLQVGDLGFNYTRLTPPNVNTKRHRAIGGNHDNYARNSPQYFKKQPIFLEDFGLHEVPGFPPIFYCRGAWSIDHDWRQREAARGGPVSWWPEEELTDEQFEAAFQLYERSKPKIVVTHEAPISLVQYVTNPQFCLQFGFPAGTITTRTNTTLQRMLDAHRPKLWCFGHFHRRWDETIDGTRFVCLDTLQRNRSNKTAVLDLTPEDFE